MRHYVANNPRGHRQADPSRKALAIRSENNHAHVVRRDLNDLIAEVIAPKRNDHTDCNTSEPIVRRTPFGLEIETYCFSHMEHYYSFAGG